MARDATERVSMMVRIPEYIRAVLKELGKETDQSANSIIVQILKEKLEEPVTGLPNRLFGRPDINNILAALYFVIVQAEMKTGKHWMTDKRTYNLALGMIARALKEIDPESSKFNEEPYHGSGLELGARVATEMIRATGGAKA